MYPNASCLANFGLIAVELGTHKSVGKLTAEVDAK